MFAHFYTDIIGINALNKGDMAIVWNKTEANSTDIHISLDVNLYGFFKKTDTIYEVQKSKKNII